MKLDLEHQSSFFLDEIDALGSHRNELSTPEQEYPDQISQSRSFETINQNRDQLILEQHIQKTEERADTRIGTIACRN